LRLKSFAQRAAIRVGLWKFESPVRLHLGCGSRNLPGFVNIDLLSGAADVLADCTRLGFLRSGSVTHILVEHMLEHLSREQSALALREWARVLQPGGVLEVEVPDLIWCMENFLVASEEDRYRHLYEGRGAVASIYGLQTNPGQFHRFGYTAEHLEDCVRACGLDVFDTKIYMTYHPCRSVRVYARKGGPDHTSAPADGCGAVALQPRA
jgi:predicted SAM-dependent methyltransferase